MSRTFRIRKNKYNPFYWWGVFRKPNNNDGVYSEIKRASGVKNDSDKERRRNENKFLHKVLKDDWDNTPYPCEKETKYIAWRYW